MKSPFFSIIIPTKNRSFLVSKAIDSVLSQEFNDYELIILHLDRDVLVRVKDILSERKIKVIKVDISTILASDSSVMGVDEIESFVSSLRKHIEESVVEAQEEHPDFTILISLI